MPSLNAAEQLALVKLQEQFPEHDVTVNRFGAAELRPLTPEELANRERAAQFVRRIEVLEAMGTA